MIERSSRGSISLLAFDAVSVLESGHVNRHDLQWPSDMTDIITDVWYLSIFGEDFASFKIGLLVF